MAVPPKASRLGFQNETGAEKSKYANSMTKKNTAPATITFT